MRSHVYVALVALAGAGCNSQRDRCPAEAKGAIKHVHDGVERYCEMPDGARAGEYTFDSPTLRVTGAYVGGERDGAWAWIPRTGPPRRHDYDHGLLTSEHSMLLGLRHGFNIERWPRRSGATDEIPPVRDASYYLCGLEVWRRSWDENGVERVVGTQFEAVPQAHEKCMKAWLATRRVPLPALLPPEPAIEIPRSRE